MGTRRILIGCGFTYAAAVSTPVVFQVEPAGSAGVSLEGGQWTSEPVTGIRGYADLYTRRKGRIVIGRGRDASDVAMATTFGNPLLESMLVQAEEDPAGEGAR